MKEETIGAGHWIFAGIFLVAFVIVMIFAYRKDLKRLRPYYRKVWVVIVVIIVIYLLIFFVNKWM